MVRRLFLLFIFLPFTVVAEQRVSVRDGMHVKAIISQNALNRIAVNNDRILYIKGNSGEFQSDKDNDFGEIHIKPLIMDKPIYIFVKTEKGRTYNLRLEAQNKGAESIILMPVENNAVQWGKAGTYEEMIKVLIKAMHNQDEIEGYMVGEASIKFPKIQNTTVKSLKTYMNDKLLGVVCEVSNTSNEEVYLPELEFSLVGVRAVSVVNKVLPPKAKTRVYLVRDLA